MAMPVIPARARVATRPCRKLHCDRAYGARCGLRERATTIRRTNPDQRWFSHPGDGLCLKPEYQLPAPCPSDCPNGFRTRMNSVHPPKPPNSNRDSSIISGPSPVMRWVRTLDPSKSSVRSNNPMPGGHRCPPSAQVGVAPIGSGPSVHTTAVGSTMPSSAGRMPNPTANRGSGSGLGKKAGCGPNRAYFHTSSGTGPETGST
jgi:hypothetical protein